MSKTFKGGHELSITHQEIFGSAKETRTFRRINCLKSETHGQKDKELVEEPNFLIHRPKEGTRNNNIFGERRAIPSPSFNPAPEQSKDKAKVPQRKKKGLKNYQGKGKQKSFGKGFPN
ncbi:hypothetical protein O181_005174 [Austropuccinia psidii MF-1]|uniref:Uncharacterized protein n=1 Tax=Austropuccinia psidii MF-1 TaxID=1389203 RepID=A0A9Q3GFM2_9BASI|nr:hypothetical protein [Austropuccinia psidii MF-1]